MPIFSRKYRRGDSSRLCLLEVEQEECTLEVCNGYNRCTIGTIQWPMIERCGITGLRWCWFPENMDECWMEVIREDAYRKCDRTKLE